MDPRLSAEENVHWDERITAVVDPTPGAYDEVHQLLTRTIAVVLKKVGFDSSTPEALEATCAAVESYMREFLRNVTEPMLASRRNIAIPPDYEIALKRMGLSEALLLPHIQAAAIPELNNLQFELAPARDDIAKPYRLKELIGPELDGETEKKSRAYIPDQFPNFPPLYTFKSTYGSSETHTDLRMVREKGVKEAKAAEGVLGRLGKTGQSSQYARDSLDRKKMDQYVGKRHDLLVALHNQEVDKALMVGLKPMGKKDEFIIINPDVTKFGIQRTKRTMDDDE